VADVDDVDEIRCSYRVTTVAIKEDERYAGSSVSALSSSRLLNGV